MIRLIETRSCSFNHVVIRHVNQIRLKNAHVNIETFGQRAFMREARRL